MPRRSAATIRPIEPDPVHRSRLVTQVINKVMLDGKKSTAERIVYDALAIIGEKTGKDSVEQLEAALKVLTPALEVRSRRVGGATYQVPVEVQPRRARTPPAGPAPPRAGGPPALAPGEARRPPPPPPAGRGLGGSARQRREKTMAQRLANELMDAINQQGGAFKRKDDIYRMAQANKAFAHYRW